MSPCEGAAWHGATRHAAGRLRLRQVTLRAAALSPPSTPWAQPRAAFERGGCGVERLDALLLPTLPIVAPILGASDVIVDPVTGERMPVRSAMLKHTQLFNMTGHPAISMPLHTPGLPVGLQLVGHLDRTAALLAVAAAVEPVVSPAVR